MSHPVISFSEHPLSLTGPLLGVVDLIIPGTVLGSTESPFAVTISHPEQHPEHRQRAIELLMEAIDEIREKLDE